MVYPTVGNETFAHVMIVGVIFVSGYKIKHLKYARDDYHCTVLYTDLSA